jgi:hypothetical protein
MNIPRAALASLVSPLCIFVPLWALGAIGLYQLIELEPPGEAKEAPIRALAFMLFVSPFMYLAASLASLVFGRWLVKRGTTSWPWFAAVACAVAAITALPLTITNGWVSWLTLSSIFTTIALPTASCWRLIACRLKPAP